MFNLLALQWSVAIFLALGVPGALGAVATLVVYFYGVTRRADADSWRRSYEAERAIVDSLRDGREAFKARAERLEHERDEQRDLKQEALSLLANEQKKTDLSELMSQLGDGLRSQEERHFARHKALMQGQAGIVGVLQAIKEALSIQNGNGGPH